jgi:hypothetical protein
MSGPNRITILGGVTIHAVASDEDPYEQDGFSSVTADIAVSDSASVAALKKSYTEKSPIIVRCGGMEIAGIVHRYSRGLRGSKIVMSVDSMQKTKPQ